MSLLSAVIQVLQHCRAGLTRAIRDKALVLMVSLSLSHRVRAITATLKQGGWEAEVGEACLFVRCK
jgi:hypothetical protein